MQTARQKQQQCACSRASDTTQHEESSAQALDVDLDSQLASVSAQEDVFNDLFSHEVSLTQYEPDWWPHEPGEPLITVYGKRSYLF
jgi:hypothetical protein